jgi:hypothetical protein
VGKRVCIVFVLSVASVGFQQLCSPISLRADINGDDGLVSSGILAFDASDNELGDDFVKSLARLLPRDNWLKAICLQNIGLSEQAALELKGALELNSALDVLDISRNNAAGANGLHVVWLA